MEDPDKTVVTASDFLVGLISETTSAVAPMIEVKEENGKKQVEPQWDEIFKNIEVEIDVTEKW